MSMRQSRHRPLRARQPDLSRRGERSDDIAHLQEDRTIRERNIDALRRFFKDDFHSEERRQLWAEDAVFELPFGLNGPVSVQGREAIHAIAHAAWDKLESSRFFDLRIYETLDPNEYFVTHGSEIVEKDGTRRHPEYINYFRMRDGKVLIRREYENPLEQPK